MNNFDVYVIESYKTFTPSEARELLGCVDDVIYYYPVCFENILELIKEYAEWVGYKGPMNAHRIFFDEYNDPINPCVYSCDSESEGG